MSQKIKTIEMDKIANISELREASSVLYDALVSEKDQLESQTALVQSIYDILDQNEEVVVELSDFIGYQFGMMASSDNMVDVAIVNMMKVKDSEIGENMHLKELCMFVSLWYNIGLSHIEIANECLHELQKSEHDLRIRIAEGEIDFDEDLAEERIIN
jgi:hypothetical protein